MTRLILIFTFETNYAYIKKMLKDQNGELPSSVDAMATELHWLLDH